MMMVVAVVVVVMMMMTMMMVVVVVVMMMMITLMMTVDMYSAGYPRRSRADSAVHNGARETGHVGRRSKTGHRAWRFDRRLMPAAVLFARGIELENIMVSQTCHICNNRLAFVIYLQ